MPKRIDEEFVVAMVNEYAREVLNQIVTGDVEERYMSDAVFEVVDQSLWGEFAGEYEGQISDWPLVVDVDLLANMTTILSVAGQNGALETDHGLGDGLNGPVVIGAQAFFSLINQAFFSLINLVSSTLDELLEQRKMDIEIIVSDAPDVWGDECDDDTAYKAADTHALKLQRMAEEWYPLADVTASVASDVDDDGIYDTVDVSVSSNASDIDYGDSVADRIYNYSQETWQQSLAETLEEIGE